MTDPKEAELLAKKAAYIDRLRALHRRERLIGFIFILAGFGLIAPVWWTYGWPHPVVWTGYGLIALGWAVFVYVIARRTAWRRANPFNPNA
ncbi:MAG: hypothetical protein ACOY4K_13240 [Pseudomonadota bacterium]